MSSNAADAEDVYTGNDVPRDVVHVRVDLSVTSIPARAFADARSWPRWSCVNASWKLGRNPSTIVTVQL
jgi:hypothetical protein